MCRRCFGWIGVFSHFQMEPVFQTGWPGCCCCCCLERRGPDSLTWNHLPPPGSTDPPTHLGPTSSDDVFYNEWKQSLYWCINKMTVYWSYEMLWSDSCVVSGVISCFPILDFGCFPFSFVFRCFCKFASSDHPLRFLTLRPHHLL